MLKQESCAFFSLCGYASSFSVSFHVTTICLGLHRLSQAKNYLSQAHWIVLQQPSCPDSVKYRIYRVYGIIHAAERQFDAARRCFADDVRTAMFTRH